MTDDAPFDATSVNAPRCPAPPLYRGDPAPWFQLPADNTPRFQFASLGGRRLVLTFLESMAAPAGRLIVSALMAGAHRFANLGTGLVIITADPNDSGAAIPEHVTGSRFLFDRNKMVAALYGAVGADGRFAPKSFIVDERLRILSVIPMREPGSHVDQVFAIYDQLGERPPARRWKPQAPVLMIPNVFEPDLCDALIKGYEREGGKESGFMIERDGRTVEATDTSFKRRSDWTVTGDDLKAACRARILRRIVPEVQRAFQFHANWIERYLVACYDAQSRGHFGAHRDNTTRGTAHRRFAVSVNLSEGYDGGHLVFPEFERVHFKPGRGEACVFSCSLLHEATPVINGRRYVFVPFLYDDAAQLVRHENEQFLDSRADLSS